MHWRRTASISRSTPSRRPCGTVWAPPRLGGSTSKRFTLIEDYSIHVLSDFIRAGKSFDFIFIDGNHRFDDVLVDFYLADQVLEVGGLMVLDDTWMASIRTVLAFVLANRAYEIVPQRSHADGGIEEAEVGRP